MFLTAAEIRELTEARAHRLQIRWLREHGYRFEVSRRGRPKVLRSAVEKRLGAPAPPAEQKPDFTALERYGQNAQTKSAPSAQDAA